MPSSGNRWGLFYFTTMGGYESALEAAGAVVHNSQYEGSYQGSWGCVVTYKEKKGLVTGSYGSCSYCDAFKSEFGDSSEDPVILNNRFYRNYDTSPDNEITWQEYEAIKSENI